MPIDLLELDRARALAEAVVDAVHQPALVLDGDLSVVAANRAFCAAFAVTPGEAAGRRLDELGGGALPGPALRRRLEETPPREGSVERFEIEPRAGAGGPRTVAVNARRVAGTALTVLALEDVTERRRAEDALGASEALSRRRLAELQAIYATAPVGLCATDTRHRYISVNAHLAAVNGRPVEAHLGRTVGEVLPAPLAETVEAICQRVVDTGEPQLDREITGTTAAELRVRRHWLASYYPIRGGDGAVIGVNTVVQDITERKRMEEALKESETRFRALADSAPVLIWMSGLDKGGVYFNRPWLDFTGRTIEQELGQGWIGSVHPEDLPALEACAEAFALRRPFRTDFRLRRRDGEWRWMLDTGVPRFAPDGTFAGYIGSCVDITERKRAEEERELLLAELSHRVKNTLATVQSIAHQTLADGADFMAARRALDGRLRALAHTHTVLAEGDWRGAGIGAVVRAELAPYGGHTRIVGEDLVLTPRAALTLGMVVHELATNAAKYGALSVPEGRVEVTWAGADDGGGGTVLRLTWREVGGPPVPPPDRRGFGRTLIERSVAYDLAGAARLEFRRDGLRCELEVPLAEAVVV